MLSELDINDPVRVSYLSFHSAKIKHKHGGVVAIDDSHDPPWVTVRTTERRADGGHQHITITGAFRVRAEWIQNNQTLGKLTDIETRHTDRSQ